MSFCIASATPSLSNDPLEKARKEYYKAVENGDFIDIAEQYFSNVKKNKRYEGVSDIYIGSLTAMRALHVLWPGSKLEYANKGIEIMESGLKKDPDNLESLFIYGSTCYHMPFFLGKGEDAEVALKKILKVYPEQSKNYDREILENALLFILNEIELSQSEKNKVYSYLGDIQD
jgi:hypothetical protein